MGTKIVILACLVLLFAELIFVLANLIFKKRAQRITFLRSFKKGKCAIIYLTAIPLYFVGHLYSGKPILESFFSSINKIINIVVLKYDTSTIKDLMNDDAVYAFTIYFCFILIGFNALLFTFSLTIQQIWSFKEGCKAMLTKKDKLFLFGYNPENLLIYKSDKKRNKVIIDNISDGECTELYKKNISFISTSGTSVQIKNIFRLANRFDREYIIVINTGNDEKNLDLCKKFTQKISESSDAVKEKLFLNMRIFVFGDPRYETVYEGVVSKAYGCINYVNKYQKIAMDFIDKYPISLFMNEEYIDYETSLLKKDVEMNVFFVGFGKTSQQILLTSVANNQFLYESDDGLDIKTVKYHVFDKYDANKNKNLNHSYYRYKNERDNMDQEDYLPLPSLPADEHFNLLDINDKDFYNRIYQSATNGSKTLNFVIVAFGTDLENIDMAQKLIEKRKEWEIDNFIIFVKIRSESLASSFVNDKRCYVIGNEAETVYNIDKILGDKIFKMAQMRNEVYDLEYDITTSPNVIIDDEYIKKTHDKAYRNWYAEKSQMERESSLYCCLSLRSKLNLMGLDYCEKDGENGLSEEEYLKIYAKDDMPDTSKYYTKANGKSIVTYDLDFAESRRKNMAVHEHQRWNSFMISKGMIPATKEQILNETVVTSAGKVKYTNGKNYSIRRHGNITTFDGLVTFRKMVAARDGVSEEEKDVIKYDYQLLDDAFWLLDKNGFKIIYKQNL